MSDVVVGCCDALFNVAASSTTASCRVCLTSLWRAASRAPSHACCVAGRAEHGVCRCAASVRLLLLLLPQVQACIIIQGLWSVYRVKTRRDTAGLFLLYQLLVAGGAAGSPSCPTFFANALLTRLLSCVYAHVQRTALLRFFALLLFRSEGAPFDTFLLVFRFTEPGEGGRRCPVARGMHKCTTRLPLLEALLSRALTLLGRDAWHVGAQTDAGSSPKQQQQKTCPLLCFVAPKYVRDVREGGGGSCGGCRRRRRWCGWFGASSAFALPSFFFLLSPSAEGGTKMAWPPVHAERLEYACHRHSPDTVPSQVFLYGRRKRA